MVPSLGHPLPDAETARQDADQARQLADADDLVVGDVADPGPAGEREEVVLAQPGERDRALDDLGELAVGAAPAFGREGRQQLGVAERGRWLSGTSCERPRAGVAREGAWTALPHARSAGEPGGELGDDPVAEHVGHVQDLEVDLVVRRDVVGVAALEPGDGLGEGQVEVVLQVGLQFGQRPVVGVEPVQRDGDVVGVCVVTNESLPGSTHSPGCAVWPSRDLRPRHSQSKRAGCTGVNGIGRRVRSAGRNEPGSRRARRARPRSVTDRLTFPQGPRSPPRPPAG